MLKKIPILLLSSLCCFSSLNCKNIFDDAYDDLNAKVPVVSSLVYMFVKPYGLTLQGDSLYLHCMNSDVYKVNPVTGGNVQYNSTSSGFSAIASDGSTLYVAKSNDVGYLNSANGNDFASLNLSPSPAFSNIYAIVSSGNDLYVSEQYTNSRIRKISGSTVSVVAGGTSGFADGTGASAMFNSPGQICTDGIYLYVCDSSNNAIRRITISSLLVETIAGPSPTASPPSGFVDGKSSDARFNNPLGIAKLGNCLYVADELNNAIRKIDLSDFSVTTIAGNVISGNKDGIGTDTQFNRPSYIISDGRVLYVSDSYNNYVRKICFVPKGEIR
jgi:hypothetical protein